MAAVATGPPARERAAQRPRVRQWRGAHVIVTGGSSGIGRAFVPNVVSQGARVSVLALPDADLEAVGNELAATGALYELAGLDITDRSAVMDAAVA